MPVTELAWIKSATPGSLPEAFVTAVRKGMEAQGEWIALHAPTLPTGPPSARGAALYQMREDPAVLLVTAHWESVAQHAECIAGEENRCAMADVTPHVAPLGVEIAHVGGVSAFTETTLGLGLLSIVRIGVEGSEGSRGVVEGVWERTSGLLEAWAGVAHLGGVAG